MPLAARWLAVVGTIALVIGLYLSFADLARYCPHLVLLTGCLFWVAFLVINEPSWNGRAPLRDMERDGGIPWGSLWPFGAMLAIALVGLYVVPLLR